MADTKRVAVVSQQIQGTDIYGDTIPIEPGRYRIIDTGHEWQTVTIISVEVDARPQSVAVDRKDITVEEEADHG